MHNNAKLKSYSCIQFIEPNREEQQAKASQSLLHRLGKHIFQLMQMSRSRAAEQEFYRELYMNG